MLFINFRMETRKSIRTLAVSGKQSQKQTAVAALETILRKVRELGLA